VRGLGPKGKARATLGRRPSLSLFAGMAQDGQQAFENGKATGGLPCASLRQDTRVWKPKFPKS
jgi:hypothetical protein